MSTSNAWTLSKTFGSAAVLLVSMGVVSSYPAMAAAPAQFTVEQAERGKTAYRAECSNCHGAALTGGQFAPPIKGPLFRQNWGGKPASVLFSFLATKMPPGAPGSLPDDTYAAILAYLLQANGGVAGARPLPSGDGDLSAVTILADKQSSSSTAADQPAAALAATTAKRSEMALVVPVSDYSAPSVVPQVLKQISAVTDAMLRDPAPGDWLIWRRTYDSLGFSPLTQINRDTVGRLGVAWAWALAPGPMEATPLVHDGVLFIQSGNDFIQALDAATGDLLWQYVRSLPPNVDNGVNVALIKRNMAIYGNLLIAATADLHVVALDVKTGKAVWDQEVGALSDRWRLTSGPVIVKGKVIQGISGASNYQPGGAYIVALDAMTGKLLWRFNTVAQQGQPGGDSWNGLANKARSGGSVWTAGSYDPDLNLVFFGPGPTYDTAPLLHTPDNRGLNNDALFTDTTIALNPDTGKLVWHYQHVRNDQWDLDWAFERTIVTLNDGKASRKYSITGGKPGLFDALDAGTGRYAFSFDFGLQNIFAAVDPVTGAKTVTPGVTPGDGKTHFVCPNAYGARNWMATSVDPETHILYVPMDETCMEMVPAPPNAMTLLTTNVVLKDVPRPGSDGKVGRLAALDLQTRKVLWTDRTRAPQTSAVLATAGGLLFNATYDRWFKSNDAATGALLWKIRLSDVAGAYPITYAVNGRQYVAIAIGGGSPHSESWSAFTPEIRNPPQRGAALWVFALPDQP